MLTVSHGGHIELGGDTRQDALGDGGGASDDVAVGSATRKEFSRRSENGGQ